jgi:hypothetical protein
MVCAPFHHRPRKVAGGGQSSIVVHIAIPSSTSTATTHIPHSPWITAETLALGCMSTSRPSATRPPANLLRQQGLERFWWCFLHGRNRWFALARYQGFQKQSVRQIRLQTISHDQTQPTNTLPDSYGERRIGALTAIKARAPVLGGNFGVWGGMFSTFDCAVKGIRYANITSV